MRRHYAPIAMAEYYEPDNKDYASGDRDHPTTNEPRPCDSPMCNARLLNKCARHDIGCLAYHLYTRGLEWNEGQVGHYRTGRCRGCKSENKGCENRCPHMKG